MTDWTGGLIPIVPPVITGIASCFEYLTVEAVRAEYDEDVEDRTDAALQRQIDQMSAYLEDQIGHTFGRALIARSIGNDQVLVTANNLQIGGDTYTFVDYPTLFSLVTAVNLASADYQLELFPQVRGDTPSTLLKTHTLTACGPDYVNRVVLCISAMFTLRSGGQSHCFLPLDLAIVNSVGENGTLLSASDYYAVPGESWIIRRSCGCDVFTCGHHGRWSCAYPGNIGVIFMPVLWAGVPGSISAAMLDAFSARAGLSPYQSEQFGDYSYKRLQSIVPTWQDQLGGSSVRRYSVKFQP